MTSLATFVTRGLPVGLVAVVGLTIWWPFGPDGSAPGPPSVPAAATVRPIEGDPAMARQRRQPDAVVAGELLAPWSAIRTQLASRATAERDRVTVDDLRDAIDALRRTRRDPSQSVALDDTLASLARIESRLRASTWADDPTIRTSLDHHRTVLERFGQ